MAIAITREFAAPVAILIVLVALAGCVSTTGGQPRSARPIYYVSPDGSDGAAGRQRDTAWQTLEHALSRAKTGGEIRVLPGAYREEIQIDGAGKRRPLTIIGFGGRPVLDGGRHLKMGFWFTDAKDLTVENLEIRGYSDMGIGAENSRNITLRDLKIHNNGFNVQLKGWELEGYGIHIENLTKYRLEGNEIYRNGPRPKKFPERLMGTGINTFGNRDGVIDNNKSYENIGGGILVEDSEDVVVKNNEVYGNDLDATREGWWDGGIWLDGGRNVVIRDNNVHGNKGPGILISDEDRQEPRGYILENNVSTGNHFGVYVWNFGVNRWPGKAVISRSDNDFSGNREKDVVIHDDGYDPDTL